MVWDIPSGTPGRYQWMHLIIRNKKRYVYGEILTVSEILAFNEVKEMGHDVGELPVSFTECVLS